ncbi:unnamed protein product, partial [marine sediment metagenome]
KGDLNFFKKGLIILFYGIIAGIIGAAIITLYN